jgi:hypothetical protein
MLRGQCQVAGSIHAAHAQYNPLRNIDHFSRYWPTTAVIRMNQIRYRGAVGMAQWGLSDRVALAVECHHSELHTVHTGLQISAEEQHSVLTAPCLRSRASHHMRLEHPRTTHTLLTRSSLLVSALDPWVYILYRLRGWRYLQRDISVLRPHVFKSLGPTVRSAADRTSRRHAACWL